MTVVTAATLLQDYSLEMTGKDVTGLTEAAPVIPPGTQVNVTFLGHEDLEMRVHAAAELVRCGFVPVPHISARRLASAQHLQEFLARLQEVGASERVFVVGGDPHTPEGPFEDALSVIRTGLLANYGVEQVSISGYPDGHPDISDESLWSALEGKVTSLREQDLKAAVITQFGFDTDPVLGWIREVRARGIDSSIRVGVPGPAGVRRLLGFARRFGVKSSAGVAHKYGFSLTNLLGTTGPDQFVADLAHHLNGVDLGRVQLHFYTFGDLMATATWAQGYELK